MPPHYASKLREASRLPSSLCSLAPLSAPAVRSFSSTTMQFRYSLGRVRTFPHARSVPAVVIRLRRRTRASSVAVGGDIERMGSRPLCHVCMSASRSGRSSSTANSQAPPTIQARPEPRRTSLRILRITLFALLDVGTPHQRGVLYKYRSEDVRGPSGYPGLCSLSYPSVSLSSPLAGADDDGRGDEDATGVLGSPRGEWV